MDKATIGGLASGAALLIISVMIAPGAKFSAFWDTASAAVVVGGAIAATAIAYPVVAAAPRNVFYSQIQAAAAAEAWAYGVWVYTAP